jgi:hypothetical protein
MQQQYGKAKGERVFYASINKGTVKGAHKNKRSKAGRGFYGAYPNHGSR